MIGFLVRFSFRVTACSVLLGSALATVSAPAARAQDNQLSISWEVRNRFRLFREERDFRLHVESGLGRSVLASEQALELQSDGRGWARNMVNRLCIDLQGRVSEPCSRDNVKESYLTPIDHPIVVRLTGPVPVGATCAWSFDDGDGPQSSTFDCAEPVNLRVRYGRTTVATVDVASGSDANQRVTTPIAVRDLLIAGLGDSIASGEGNPDRPIALSDEGFCFRSYLGGAQYYRPSRAGYKGGRACEAPDTLTNWQRQSALWLNSACHRSLYSYQTRTALALAVQYPHIAVTYLPLACTGATIADGLLGSQQARECLPTKTANTCSGTVNGQIAELRTALAAAKRRQPDRALDLLLLSIGANDIYFSGLVANVIVDTPTERTLFSQGGSMASVDDARSALARDLPADFAKLRDALKPLVGGDLSGALRDAGQATGGNAVAAGRQGELAIEELAQLLGWLTFVIPSALLLIAALPRRIRKVRQINVAAQVLRADSEEARRLLAMRAAFALPFGTLLSYTRDPFGDLQAGNYDALLRAVYEDCGLRAPTGKPMAGAGFEPA